MSGPKKEDNAASPFSGLLSDPMDVTISNDTATASADIAREAAQIAGLHAEIARLQAESAELKDRYLRSVAEVENVRKRSEREKIEAGQFAFSRFAKDLLSVVDNFSRALDALTPETRAALPPAARPVIDGIEATQREMLAIFDRHGIKRIEAKGKRFDPHLHSAIAEIPSAEHAAGTVVDVAQQGYTIGGRLLREAMVIVSAGAPARNGAGSSSLDTSA
jgi:molecular chaperone GrpE